MGCVTANDFQEGTTIAGWQRYAPGLYWALCCCSDLINCCLSDFGSVAAGPSSSCEEDGLRPSDKINSNCREYPCRIVSTEVSGSVGC